MNSCGFVVVVFGLFVCLFLERKKKKKGLPCHQIFCQYINLLFFVRPSLKTGHNPMYTPE